MRDGRREGCYFDRGASIKASRKSMIFRAAFTLNQLLRSYARTSAHQTRRSRFMRRLLAEAFTRVVIHLKQDLHMNPCIQTPGNDLR